MQQYCSCHDRSVLCRDIKFVATSFSYFSTSENCRNINFFVATIIFTFSFSTLSRQSFLCRDILSVVTQKLCRNRVSFYRDIISSLIIVDGRPVCCKIEIFVATNLSWLISILFHFLSRHNFLLSRQNSITLQLLFSR